MPTSLKKLLTEAPQNRARASVSGVKNLKAFLERAVEIHTQLGAWIDRFPGVLKEALKESADLKDKATMQLVWQDRFVAYWREIRSLEKELSEIAYDAEGVDYPKGAAYETLHRDIERALSPLVAPAKARTEYAIEKIHFKFSTKLDRKDHIAYEVPRLQEWAEAFEKWTTDTKSTLQVMLKKAR